MLRKADLCHGRGIRRDSKSVEVMLIRVDVLETDLSATIPLGRKAQARVEDPLPGPQIAIARVLKCLEVTLIDPELGLDQLLSLTQRCAMIRTSQILRWSLALESLAERGALMALGLKAMAHRSVNVTTNRDWKRLVRGENSY